MSVYERNDTPPLFIILSQKFSSKLYIPVCTAFVKQTFHLLDAQKMVLLIHCFRAKSADCLISVVTRQQFFKARLMIIDVLSYQCFLIVDISHSNRNIVIRKHPYCSKNKLCPILLTNPKFVADSFAAYYNLC